MPRSARDDADEIHEPIWELPLLEFIERASKGKIKAPIHLAPLAEEIERAERLEGVETVGAAPVQHGKTTLLVYGIAWILLRHPDRPIIYITYGQQFSEKQSRRIRAIYLACGGKVKADYNTIKHWETEQGGGLHAVGADGEVTGNPAVHIFYDDPYKNRQEAENPEHRELIEEKFSSEVVTRLAPGGSIMIVASRWHEDDLSGVRIRAGYKHVHLRAIERVEVVDENGEVTVVEQALCPWGPDPRYPRTLEFLRTLRDGDPARGIMPKVLDYDWASLYQGEPKPKDAGLFRNAYLYERKSMPRLVALAIGCDFAYSATGDKIAIVVLGLGEDGIVYVLHVQTWQRSVLENMREVRAVFAPFRGARKASYVSGPERGVINYLARLENEPKHKSSCSCCGPIIVHPLPAKLSKYVRAGRTAQRWNRKGIRVLAGASWADPFIRVVCGFTGIEGKKDDEVDALVSGHDVLMVGEAFDPPGGKFTAGARVM